MRRFDWTRVPFGPGNQRAAGSATKNVLLLVHDDVGQEARLRVALDLVRTLGGHLICLEAHAMPLLDDDFPVAVVNGLFTGDESIRASENRRRLCALLAGRGVAATWINAGGGLAWELASAMADLVVVSRRLEEAPAGESREVVSQVTEIAGRIMVAVAAGSGDLAAGDRAEIVFDGTAAVLDARSTAAAIPALARTATASRNPLGLSGRRPDEAASPLSRHGIGAHDANGCCLPHSQEILDGVA